MDVKIHGYDFFVDEEICEGTEGLWKRLTLNIPDDVSSEDLETNRDMLIHEGFSLRRSEPSEMQ